MKKSEGEACKNGVPQQMSKLFMRKLGRNVVLELKGGNSFVFLRGSMGVDVGGRNRHCVDVGHEFVICVPSQRGSDDGGRWRSNHDD